MRNRDRAWLLRRDGRGFAGLGHPREQRLGRIGCLEGGKRHRRLDVVLPGAVDHGVAHHARDPPRHHMGVLQRPLREHHGDRPVVALAGEIDAANDAAHQPREIEAGACASCPGFAVTPFPAEHSAGAPCYSLRVEVDGKVVTYSGDTGWTDALLAAARDADLFICECSSHERRLTGHLSYAELAPHLAASGARRVILTHLNLDMLERLGALAHETAHDGLTMTL